MTAVGVIGLSSCCWNAAPMAYSSTASFSASMFSRSGPSNHVELLSCGGHPSELENKLHQLNRKRVDGFGRPLFGASCSGVPSGLTATVWAATAGVEVVEAEACPSSRLAVPDVDASQGLYGRVGRWRRGRMPCTPMGLGRWRRLCVNGFGGRVGCRVTVCALTVDSGDVSVSRSEPDVACPSVVGGFEEEEADSSASSIDDGVELECGGSDEAGDFAAGRSPIPNPRTPTLGTPPVSRTTDRHQRQRSRGCWQSPPRSPARPPIRRPCR